MASPTSPSTAMDSYTFPDWNSIAANIDQNAGTNSIIPVEQLQLFIAVPFRMPVSQSWLNQMEAAIVSLTILLVLGTAVVWRRISEKSFWLFRTQARGEGGVLVIPNAVTSFVVAESTFVIVWIAYAIEQILVARGKLSPDLLICWLGLIWWPLILGAFLAGWGTFFASPLQAGKGSRRPSSRKITDGSEDTTGARRKRSWNPFRSLSAPIMNALVLGVPLLQLALIAVSTGLADRKWRPAVAEWTSLDQELDKLVRFAKAQPDPTSSGQIPVELNNRAARLWTMADDALSGMELIWWAWFASAIAFTTFYSVSGGALLYQLRREVRFLKGVVELKYQNEVEELEDGLHIEGQKETIRARRAEQPPAPEGSSIAPNFWPPILDKKSIAPAPRQRGPSSSGKGGSHRSIRNAQYETMRKAFFLISIQVICISVAAGGFSSLALVLALKIRHCVRDHYFTQLYETCNLIAAWISVIFGGAIFLAITARTFEFLTDVVLAAARGGSSRSGEQSRKRTGDRVGSKSGCTGIGSKNRHEGNDTLESLLTVAPLPAAARRAGAERSVWQDDSIVPFEPDRPESFTVREDEVTEELTQDAEARPAYSRSASFDRKAFSENRLPRYPGHAVPSSILPSSPRMDAAAAQLTREALKLVPPRVASRESDWVRAASQTPSQTPDSALAKTMTTPSTTDGPHTPFATASAPASPVLERSFQHSKPPALQHQASAGDFSSVRQDRSFRYRIRQVSEDAVKKVSGKVGGISPSLGVTTKKSTAAASPPSKELESSEELEDMQSNEGFEMKAMGSSDRNSSRTSEAFSSIRAPSSRARSRTHTAGVSSRDRGGVLVTTSTTQSHSTTDTRDSPWSQYQISPPSTGTGSSDHAAAIGRFSSLDTTRPRSGTYSGLTYHHPSHVIDPASNGTTEWRGSTWQGPVVPRSTGHAGRRMTASAALPGEAGSDAEVNK